MHGGLVLSALPVQARAAAGGSAGSAHAADMAARMQPAEQQAVLQARPIGGGEGATQAAADGLLAWPGVARLGLPALRMPDFSSPARPADEGGIPCCRGWRWPRHGTPTLPAARAARVPVPNGNRGVPWCGWGIDLLPSGRLQAGEDQVLAGAPWRA
ncbi:hypothetical protein RAA17_06295 [Komagataeibacter rhaeticus]|nr:hypothetical protein [Komagataeibacter rhaeticus]